MARTDFTYELRKLPEDAFGVEDYVVRTAGGDPVGTVAGLLERDGRLLLAVESGLTPLAHIRRVLPWDVVAEVDHEALAVWLRLDEAGFERAPELDPADARAPGESAEARRLVELPPELSPRPEVSPGGPVDRSPLYVSMGLAIALVFSVLVLVAVATAWETPWLALGLVVPAALGVASLLFALRAWRTPYEPRGEQKP